MSASRYNTRSHRVNRDAVVGVASRTRSRGVVLMESPLPSTTRSGRPLRARTAAGGGVSRNVVARGRRQPLIDLAPPETNVGRRAARKRPDSLEEINTKRPRVSIQPCAICLGELDDSDAVASIDSCSHRFCYDCIGNWADRENTCPLCKTRFTKITKLSRDGGDGGVDVEETQRDVEARDQNELAPGEELRLGEAMASLIGTMFARVEGVNGNMYVPIPPSIANRNQVRQVRGIHELLSSGVQTRGFRIDERTTVIVRPVERNGRPSLGIFLDATSRPQP
eukprot:CAMPEP_0194039676 /NCGR_PEP_ID=MMETSP0009_2-20130614/11784_1 /TAXON_ID=210454 /ORGANISM="Grammatophora oceanica, Strain CCMP 410" /LENGTH=280 /DNA_ID=CAMNT_0038682589 /DNA_START=54 /DNA_END=896 /DNA_ORIENTATION=+